eukprot:TRINITY_DN10656_c0_g1_i4.p1 TRINITY_DN10656_c0_g1~~TRINITY_DN10656_c0_g1_i4.p1  ORF type:complete len:145 (-),score=17.66 TRINITY_DN10656_c0_g1_i4:74-508(-)
MGACCGKNRQQISISQDQPPSLSESENPITTKYVTQRKSKFSSKGIWSLAESKGRDRHSYNSKNLVRDLKELTGEKDVDSPRGARRKLTVKSFAKLNERLNHFGARTTRHNAYVKKMESAFPSHLEEANSDRHLISKSITVANK